MCLVANSPCASSLATSHWRWPRDKRFRFLSGRNTKQRARRTPSCSWSTTFLRRHPSGIVRLGRTTFRDRSVSCARDYEPLDQASDTTGCGEPSDGPPDSHRAPDGQPLRQGRAPLITDARTHQRESVGVYFLISNECIWSTQLSRGTLESVSPLHKEQRNP